MEKLKTCTKHGIFILTWIILFFTSCDQFDNSPYEPIQLTALEPMPGEGRSVAVSFVIHDTAYVALGKSKINSGGLNDCWAYHPKTNDWTQKKSFPGKPRVNAIAEVVNNKAYVGLGYDMGAVYSNTSYLNDFYMYDAATNSWERKADFPGKRENRSYYSAASATFVLDSLIYVACGFDGNAFLDIVWVYNTKNDSWTKINNFKGPGRAGATACTNGSRTFMGTGYRIVSDNQWWEYISETDTWIQKKNIPGKGRVNAVAFCVDNRFFLSTGRHFGGEYTDGLLFDDILEYNPILDQWYYRGSLPTGRENAIQFTYNRKSYIGLGETDERALNDLWCFAP